MGQESTDSEWMKKRMYPRISWTFMVRYRLRDEGGASWNVSVIKNISLGGCYFYSNTFYKVGQMLSIKVQFPAVMGAMKFTGEVKRCDERREGKSSYGLAVQFTEIDKARQTEFLDALGFFMNKQFKDKG